MHKPRPPFSEAVVELRQFLIQNGCSDKLRWVSRADITGYRSRFWVYRPAELANEQLSEAFYNAAISTPGSVRLHAIFQYEGYTLVWVDDYGGDSRFLNYGIWTSPHTLTAVKSSLVWRIQRAINRLRGESPILQSITIPKQL